KLISKTGYSVSFSTLIVAFLILASIRKLRCPRNSLHMHLFLSFIMRALMFFLKDSLFIEGVGFSSNIGYSEDNFSLFRHEKNNIDCKVFTSFWQYFLMANYCWILIEGLYLHNLIFLSIKSDNL
ncbi:secretin receptor-like, partial [Centruroides sculpturatus]|uniref:secretin receptor-like n=1 Tax=Centruroides sculpturatus TaxID=218467 RepID=UPI000C6E23A9